MKKLYSLLLFVIVSNSVFAQNTDSKTTVIRASEFSITRPIRDIFAENPVDENKDYGETESGDRKVRIPQKFPLTAKDNGYAYANDTTTIQTKMGTIPGLPTRLNIAGQTASGFRPFDPSGAVGPNHYVQMINSTTFKIYNKTTGAVMLTGTLGNLWTPATANAGDPIVMYDKAADRWFLAQFGSSTDKKIYIAVSATNDPTGAYYTYTYVSAQFPDYLKFSVWADGYYMTSNQSTQKVFCFNRAEILAGTPAARSVVVNFTPPSSGFFCPLPGDAGDGTLPAYGTPCPIMSYSDNGWGAGYSDAINIYNMSVDWIPTTPTASITLNTNLATAAFDASYNSSWNDCVQPGTTQKLDGIGGVLMYRAQWKSWAGYNTIVLNWGVNISATQRSIKWCELRQNQTTNVWSIYQEGIYTPDAATRWMGSIAMDNNGSIGLSYLKSDATSIYPGLYYTGRRASDPLGTMPVAEVMAVAGTGYQTGTNRVGDYAHTTLDVDGITFWNTSEYMGGTSGGSAASTRVFSYQITPIGNTAFVSILQTSGTNPLCPNGSATFTATPTNGGTAPVYQWQVNGVNVGTNSSTFTTNTLTNGQIVTCIMTSNMVGVVGSPATSSGITINVNAVVTPSVTIAQTIGTNPFCLGNMNGFTATPTNGGTTPTYQWKIDGTNVGTNSNTFSTTTLTNGQIVTCEMISNAICISTPNATSNTITMNTSSATTPVVTVTQTGGSNPFCLGSTLTFTASVTNGSTPSYQWKVDGVNVGTNSATYSTSSLTNNQVVTCEAVVQPLCQFSGTVGDVNSTTLNGTSSDVGAAYPTYYGNGRQQYLITASELTTLGFTAGNLSSLGFTINGTVGNPATLNGYTIKLAHTAVTALTTTFQTPTFTTVYGPINYTPVLNSTNVHPFSTFFNWDGTSNVLVDICFSNQVTGTTAYQNLQTTTAFVSSGLYQADGATGATACTQTGATTGSIRPNMIFTKAGTGTTVLSNNITVTTTTSNLVQSVSIAQTTGSNPMCLGASATFTATPTNGGTTPAYQWKVNGTNVGTNSSTFTTTTLTNGQIVTCVMTSNAPCVTTPTATSNGITINISANTLTTAVSIAQTVGTNPACAGSLVTFAATPTNGGSPSYQWKVNGINVGTNSASYSTSTLTNGQIVTCVMTSTALCVISPTATSNGITMGINAATSPTASIAQTGGTNPLCDGGSASFSATVINGINPSYQWKINGNNVGTNNSIFTTSSLTNGQIITCNVTASPSCPTTATLGNINSTTLNTVSNDLACAYPTYYGNGRQQYLIRASELTALGFTAGTISSLGFTINGTVGDPAILNGYTIKIGNTAATVLNSTFQTSTFTTVFGPVNYTPTVSSLNTHNFTTPFVWNGTSNIVVDICFSNQVVGATAYQNYQTTTSFVSATNYNADGATGAGACTQLNTTNTSATGSKRPNMTIVMGAGTSVINSNSISVNVNPLPTVIANNVSGCQGSFITLDGTPIGGVYSIANPYLGNSTTYSYTFTDINGCTATSNIANVTVNACSITLNLKAFLQGFYLGSSTMNPVLFNQGESSNTSICDTVTIELHEANSPFSFVNSFTGIIGVNGLLNCSFPAAVIGNNYYIVVKHRNSIETWSANPVLITTITNYDFTNDISKAYGSNMIDVYNEGVFSIYSGDINQDGSIDGLDYPFWENDYTNSAFGYYNTDLNGDGSVDGLDYPLWENNYNQSVFFAVP